MDSLKLGMKADIQESGTKSETQNELLGNGTRLPDLSRNA
jgi:hypothetical protein